jgi:hypothetical protein
MLSYCHEDILQPIEGRKKKKIYKEADKGN